MLFNQYLSVIIHFVNILYCCCFFSALLHYLKNVTELLWSAPELLRLAPEDWPPCGTRAGDIYSLGIIMQEIHTRALPFARDDIMSLDGMPVLSEPKKRACATGHKIIHLCPLAINDYLAY